MIGCITLSLCLAHRLASRKRSHVCKEYPVNFVNLNDAKRSVHFNSNASISCD
jgi:hypothetical protein